MSSGVLAGCSSSDSPSANGVDTLAGNDVLAASLSAADAQTSMRVVTKGARNSLPFGVDMLVRRNGGGSGTVWIGAEKLSLVTTTSDLFIKADTAYWTTQMDPAYAKAIGDKWVKAPLTSKAFASFATLGSFDALLGTFLQPSGPTTRGDVTTILDQPAVQVVSTQGSVWIATKGNPLPVQVDTPSTGDITRFGEWGTAVEVAVPSAAETVDLGALGVK
jgi:hypothetical protein